MKFASSPNSAYDVVNNSDTGGHGRKGMLLLFVDGHSKQCDFTASMKRNLMHGLEPGKDWMWYKPR